MFKTDSFLSNKKSSLNQNVWCDHAIVYPYGQQWGYMEKNYKMQQKMLLHLYLTN